MPDQLLCPRDVWTFLQAQPVLHAWVAGFFGSSIPIERWDLIRAVAGPFFTGDEPLRVLITTEAVEKVRRFFPTSENPREWTADDWKATLRRLELAIRATGIRERRYRVYFQAIRFRETSEELRMITSALFLAIAEMEYLALLDLAN